jgi:cyclopropane fatty-acyl-phospholipid synthase-like methyltransferase
MNWKDVAKLPEQARNVYLHPAANASSQAYWESGEYDASLIQCQIEANSVLEFGCGNGRILKNLYYSELYGVDISPEMITGVENASLVSDFHKQVEAIFSWSVFIHLTSAEKLEAMKWIYDHLKVGGRAYLQIPIYDKTREPESFIDVGVLSLEDFMSMAKQVGFTVEEIHSNYGEFSYSNVGANHNLFQVLKK